MSNRFYFILLIISAICASVIQVLVKKIASQYQFDYLKAIYDPLTFLTIALYIVAFIGWYIALSKLHFSVAIPVSAIGIIASAGIGYYVFNEPIGVNKIIAFVLITLAMVLLYFDAIKN